MSWSPKRRAHPATVRATCSYLHGGSPVSLGFRLPRLTRKPVVLGAAATLVAGVALAPAVASAHEGVNGLGRAAGSGHVTQKAADGTPLPCLPQNDVNLTSPTPLPATCHGPLGTGSIDSAFANQPFVIDNHIKPEDKTCPAPAPGTWCTGSTRSPTRSTGAGRTATSPVATRSAWPWGCTTPGRCPSTSSCTARARRSTSSLTTSSRARSAAPSSTTSG